MPWRRGAEKPTVRQRPSAWDDRRRNRNLGTAKRGHGKSSPSVIPTPRWYGERFFSEVLYRPDHVIRSVGNIKLEFLIERPRTGYHYACTIDDIVHQMMNLMPWRRDWKGMGITYESNRAGLSALGLRAAPPALWHTKRYRGSFLVVHVYPICLRKIAARWARY
jgi:hypothetical protein